MDLVIWGTGDDASEFLALCDMGKVKVVGFVDEDKSLTGEKFLGCEVLRPERLIGASFDALIITGRDWRAIKEQATDRLGVPKSKVHGYYEKRFRLLRQMGKEGLIPADVPHEALKALDGFPWYHQVEVFPGVKTAGGEPPKLFILDQLLDQDLSGKKALDIGAWNGPFSFEMERRGAEVTAFDIQDPATSGFNFLKEFKGSKVEYVRDSVYNLNRHFDKRFDVVTFLGVFYHLFNPMLALTNIYDVMADDGVLLFEGAILDFAHNHDPFWQARRDRIGAYIDVPLAYFTSGEYHGDRSNWYIPNLLCLKEWLIAAGFEVEQTFLIEHVSRAFGRARKLPQRPIEHPS